MQQTFDFDAPVAPTPKAAAKEPQVFSVSELNKSIRGMLEGQFPLLWLKGEISNFKPHSSGHWYFSLKDSKAQISAVMFRGFNQGVRFKPTEGMEVLVRGKITVYEPRGGYQIFCELMDPVGAGAMQMAFEQLKAKLQSEGLFDQARKRALPKLPQHVAVVTSPTGAAIRDILNVLGRRFKSLKVTLVPAVVQGAQAPKSIIAAIELANRLNDVDVMIVGRGGGSVEDMWCFNDEQVARAIAASRIPTISAVGHEIDFTIADFVADLRAPTPSAAAEIVVKSTAELSESVDLRKKQLWRLWQHKMQMLARQVVFLQQRLVDPKRRLQDLAQRCDELQARLNLAIENSLKHQRAQVQMCQQKLGSPLQRISLQRQKLSQFDLLLRGQVQIQMERSRARYNQLALLLDSLSPLKVLDRGYAIATQGQQVVTDASTLKVGDELNVQVAKGRALTTVKQVLLN